LKATKQLLKNRLVDDRTENAIKRNLE